VPPLCRELYARQFRKYIAPYCTAHPHGYRINFTELRRLRLGSAESRADHGLENFGDSL
jgi:hypothetical protein